MTRVILGSFGTGTHLRVIAEVAKFGVKRSKEGRSISLVNIQTTGGSLITDHIWVDEGPFLAAIPALGRRDVVCFTGVIYRYLKNEGWDWSLGWPYDIGLYLRANERNTR